MEQLFWDFACGLSWERFCRVFVQCLVCKSVAFREGLFLHHHCAAPGPVPRSTRPDNASTDVGGDHGARAPSRVRVRLSKVNGRLVSIRVAAGDRGRTYTVHQRSSRRAPAHCRPYSSRHAPPYDSDTEIVPDSEPEAEEQSD